MIVECPYCEARVNTTVLQSHIAQPGEDYPLCYRTSFLECSVCKNTLLVGQDESPFEEGWFDPIRLWPQPTTSIIDWKFPTIVRESLQEAQKCIRARAFLACAVMCGRALEAICREHNTKSKSIHGGLRELLERKVIDERLFQWGEELRKHRNLAAHATGEKITKEDAQDLFDFVQAICNYIFILSARFEEFMQRKTPTQSKPNSLDEVF